MKKVFNHSVTMSNITPADVERAYSAYYRNQSQTGHGISKYYKGSVYQRGHGFGNAMSGLLNIIKPVGKFLAKKGVKALAGIAGDVISGVPPKVAAKRRAVKELEGMKASISNKLINTLGVGGTPTKKRKKSVIKRGQKKKRSDVFGKY